jgi:putative RecB family exonuclease
MAEPSGIDLSFSRVQAYQRCPWLYHLVYNLGWRSGPSAAAALGQSVHRALGRFLAPDNAEKTYERLQEIFDEEWVNEGFQSPEETLAAYQSGQAMLEKFFQSEKAHFGEVVATEKEFNLPFEGDVRFRGTLDRLDKKPNGEFEIVEYKTGAEVWTPSRTESDLQMTLYALGMKSVLQGSPVRLRYHFLASGESRTVERNDTQLENARVTMSDIARKIRAKDFTPDNRYCRRCEFARRCTYYMPLPESGERQ